MPELKSKINALLILRNNIEVDDDVNLATREFSSLLGCDPSNISLIISEVELKDYFDSRGHSTLFSERLWSRKREGVVALAYEGHPQSTANVIARRIAFGQELLIFGAPTDIQLVCGSLTEPLITYQKFDESTNGVSVVSYICLTALVEWLCAYTSSLNRSQEIAQACDTFLLAMRSGRSRAANYRGVQKATEARKTTLYLTHDLHIFKAKFFPRMVRALINIQAQAGDVVVDPFVGSGTLLLEASLCGYRSVGFDVDPVSVLSAQTKVTPFAFDPKNTRRDAENLLCLIAKPVEGHGLFAENNSVYYGDAGLDLIPKQLREKLRRKDTKEHTNNLDEIANDVGFLAAVLSDSRVCNSPIVQLLVSDAISKKIRFRFNGTGNGSYTIEVVRQSIIGRLTEKTLTTIRLCTLFEWLQHTVLLQFGESFADAQDAKQLSLKRHGLERCTFITSPPYLPASSGREHYYVTRALIFSLLGKHFDESKFLGYANGNNSTTELSQLPKEASALLDYLRSDSDRTDAQNDPMRFRYKAAPTQAYLHGVGEFFRNLADQVPSGTVLSMIVAKQHTFYSHKRQEIEYQVSGKNLYGEIGTQNGWQLDECIDVELMKHATSQARPQSKGEYSESILVFRRA